MSSKPTPAQERSWIAAWRSASVALERIRADEFRDADLAAVAAQLDGLTLASLREHPSPPTSGLIEQQRIFLRAAP